MKKKIIDTIIIFSLFIFIIYILFIVLDLIDITKYLKLSNEYDWLAFSGAIIGGTFTLFGVLITIYNENEKKREEDSIKYKPVFKLSGINTKERCLLREVNFSIPFGCKNNIQDYEKNKEQFYKQVKSETPLFRIYLKNKGRGETYNTILEKAELVSVSWDSESNIYYSNGLNQFIGEVYPEESIGIDVYMPQSLYINENFDRNNHNEICINIIINYSDMFNRVKYQDIINIKLKVIVDKVIDNKELNYKENFKLAKVKYDIIELLPEHNIYSEKKKKYIHESLKMDDDLNMLH